MKQFRNIMLKWWYGERDLQKSLEALLVPDLLWRREKRPFLLRKRLILARLAAGHVPASLPPPPAWGQMQPRSALRHPCAALHLSLPPPKASAILAYLKGHICKLNRPLSPHPPNHTTSGLQQRTGRLEEREEYLNFRLSILGEAVQPQPRSKPYGWAMNRKLGQTHLVLKWFYARKGTVKPHFSINTFLSLSPSPCVDGALSKGWGVTQKLCCTSQGHFWL